MTTEKPICEGQEQKCRHLDQAEAKLNSSGSSREYIEERFRAVFDAAPVSIWEQDYSDFKSFIDTLKNQGIIDFRRYFEEHPDLLKKIMQMFKIIDVNQHTLTMFEATDKKSLLKSLDNIFLPETMNIFREELIVVAQGRLHYEAETVFKTLTGKQFDALFAINYSDWDSILNRVVVTVVDISERKQAEGVLKKSREDLEQRVNERTSELSEINERLKHEITERTQTEEMLLKSEKKFRFITENIVDIVWTLDRDFKTTYASPSIEKLLGFTAEERKQQTLEEMIAPESLHRVQMKFLEELHKDELDDHDPNRSVTMEVEYYRKDGSTVWMENTVTAIRNMAGDLVGMHGVSRDITERKRAEETLKERTQTLNEILEKAADGICVCYNTSEYPFVKFSHWNPRMTEITGYTIEEINRLGWHQSLYPDPEIQQKAVERMASMRQGNDIKAEEWVVTAKDQTQRAVSMSTSVLKEDDGVIHVLAMMQDVSERKEYQDQLVVSRKEWEDIFQAIGHPAIILDPKHGIIKSNKAALNLTGLTENQLKGRKCFDVFHTTDEPPGSCPMEALLHTGSLETIEMIMEALDGTFLVSCTPITDKDGNVEKIIHIATDITESKRLESELRHAHKVEALGTLSGGIAHEFNNILGIIIGNTELALDDVPEWNPAKDCLEEIRTASLRAKDVVRRIMSFARKTPATRKPIMISNIIQESLKLMRATIPANIEIKQEILCESEMILANPTEINQILMNLCNNSVHAIDNDTGMLKIRLETTVLDHHSASSYESLRAGEYVKLTVKDSGNGIDPKIMASIFDPYFTTKDVDKGLGMGLAVVYGIVKKHDGAIRVNSKVGKGTTVEVLFPITKETAQIEKEVSKDLPRGTERILFVDDEASLVKLVTQMLERQGYKVVGKTSSTEALQLFQEESEKFDLVITDMAMPELPGDRLAQELIKIRPKIPVIICTGHSDRMDEGKATMSGIAAYTMKPLVKTDLVNTVRRVLDKSKGLAR